MSNLDAFQDWYKAFLGEMIQALEPFGPRHDGTGGDELFRRFYVNSRGPRTENFVVGMRSVPTKDRVTLNIG